MFDKLTRFFAEILTSDARMPDASPDDARLTFAALLVHVAAADGLFSASEQRVVQDLLQRRFNLDAHAVKKLIAEAERRDREETDLSGFVSVLKRALSASERRRLVEMMWDVARADGKMHEFEENVVLRVCELLEAPTHAGMGRRLSDDPDFEDQPR